MNYVIDVCLDYIGCLQKQQLQKNDSLFWSTFLNGLDWVWLQVAFIVYVLSLTLQSGQQLPGKSCTEKSI